MKEMESRIIYHIEKFITYLFGENNENDADQRIYNKLLQMEGKELEPWINEKLKKYIICATEYYELEDNMSKYVFKLWYATLTYYKNDKLCMKYHEIFNKTDPNYTEELETLKMKLRIYQGPNAKIYDDIPSWKLCIIADYMEMYIMTMNPIDLKFYIIQLVEPFEIR
jgi:hypothetical protein